MASNLALQIHYAAIFEILASILHNLACRGAAIIGLNNRDFLLSLMAPGERVKQCSSSEVVVKFYLTCSSFDHLTYCVTPLLLLVQMFRTLFLFYSNGMWCSKRAIVVPFCYHVVK